MCARFVARCGLLWLATLLLAPVSWTSRSEAQQPAPLPSNWQSLGVSDFVTAVSPYYDLDAETLFYPTIDDGAVRRQAATLIANVDYSGSQYDLPTLNILHLLANPKLSARQQTRITNGVLARQDNWTGQPFSVFNAKWNLMFRLKLSDLSRIQEGTRWAQAGGQLSAVPPQNLPEAYLYFATTPPQSISGSYSVRWQGQVTAPQSGAYTFSISPINVNSQDSLSPVQLTVTVNVGGSVVLTANSTQWTKASSPVTLTAGQAVSLVVNWSAQVGQQMPNRALHALLLWQGPGVSQSIVPPSALTLPDGSAVGLQTTYTWTNSSGQQQTLTRTEPNIDAAWTSRPVWLLPDVSLQTQAGALLLQTVTSSTYLALLEFDASSSSASVACCLPGSRCDGRAPHLFPAEYDSGSVAVAADVSQSGEREFVHDLFWHVPGGQPGSSSANLRHLGPGACGCGLWAGIRPCLRRR